MQDRDRKTQSFQETLQSGTQVKITSEKEEKTDTLIGELLKRQKRSGYQEYKFGKCVLRRGEQEVIYDSMHARVYEQQP